MYKDIVIKNVLKFNAQILGIYQYITTVYGLKNHIQIFQEDLIANSVKPSNIIFFVI